VPEDGADTRLLQTLSRGRFVPVVACIGLGRDGRLFNVNADTVRGHLAARLGARRLVIAGTTPGVLDAGGATLPILPADAVARLVNDGTRDRRDDCELRACEHGARRAAWTTW
jgi:acetylglutamate kinase